MSSSDDRAPLAAGDPGAGPFRARAQEPEAVLLAGDVLRWMIPTVGKFPKNLRFGLGSRIEGALTDVLENLVTAQYTTGQARRQALSLANSRLQVARHLVRMAAELRVISQKQLMYAAELMVRLGKQVGGWQKATDAGLPSASPTPPT